MKIVFATHNTHKLSEIRAILAPRHEIAGLDDIGFPGDVDETAPTLEGNALIKARHAHALCGLPCFADDTGLEVTALGGRPGVHTARYAYPDRHDPAANNLKLLGELRDKADRTARFRTVIALIAADGEEHLFEGVAEGEIALAEQGEGGFGYDPLFIPRDPANPLGLTFAQLGAEAKNRISHRARAVARLAAFLEKE